MTPRQCTVIALMVAAACGTTRTPETRPAEAAPTQLVLPNGPRATAQDQRALPIWFSPALGLRSAADATAKLDAKNALGFGVLVRDNELRMPATCREREALRARGFAPETTLQAQSDAGAEIRCRTLHLLTHVQPAHVTYLPMTLEDSLLGQLPAALATVTSNEHAAQRHAATRAGKSLKDFEPQAHVTIDPSGAPVIIERALGTRIDLELQARGDFDADGTEDMAVSVSNGTGHGRYSEMRLLVLTRTEETAMLSVMR